MDINQLYHDHQLTLMRATLAQDKGVRAAHEDDAAQIARRIEGNLRQRDAPAARGWEVRYRSEDQPASSSQPVSSWLKSLPRRTLGIVLQ